VAEIFPARDSLIRLAAAVLARSRRTPPEDTTTSADTTARGGHQCLRTRPVTAM